MKLKQILESIVSDLEGVAALTSSIEGALIRRNLLTSEEIVESLPNVRHEVQKRLSDIRFSISRLPE